MAKEAQERVVTPKFRVAFANVFEPKPAMAGGKPKYSLMAIFPPGTDLSKMNALAKAACDKKFPNGRPASMRVPFRKGEEKAQYDGFEPGTIFCTISSQYQPQIITHDKREIFTPQEFYSGCWARATVHAYAYDTAGNQGVAFGLNNIQKLGDDKPFAGRVDAADDFDAVAEIPYEGSEAAPPADGADDFLS